MHLTRVHIRLPHITKTLIDRNNPNSSQPKEQTPSINITSNLPEYPSNENHSAITKGSFDTNEDNFFKKIRSMFCESEKRIALNITETMETRISTMESDIKQLKSAANVSDGESEDIYTRLSSMEQLINGMRSVIDQRQTRSRTTRSGSVITNAIISGVPYSSKEDLKQIIATLFSTIGVKTEVRFTAFRLLKSTTSSDCDQIPKILVKLNSMEDKKIIFKLKRNKTILSTDLKVEGQSSKVYISEQLSTETGFLLKMVRELRKFGIKYVWTNNGNVLVKSDSNAVDCTNY